MTKEIAEIKRLHKLLQHNELYFQQIAAKELGMISWQYPEHAKIIVQILSETLPDNDVNGRYAAIRALGWMGEKSPEQIVPVLIKALKDKHRSIRSGAAQVLSEIGKTALAAEFALREAIKDENSTVRKFAVLALGNMSTKALPNILDTLKDEKTVVREAAVEALGEHAKNKPEYTEEIIQALGKVIRTDNYDVRRNTVFVLGELGKPAVPVLIKALKDEHEYIRDLVIQKLGEIGDSAISAVPALAEMSLSGMTVQIAEVLSKIVVNDSKQANKLIPFFIELLLDEDEFVCEMAAEALERLGKHDLELVILALNSALKNDLCKGKKAVSKALEELAKIAPMQVASALIETLKTDGFAKRCAVEILANIGELVPKKVAEVTTQLTELLDDHEVLAAPAAKALGFLRGSSAEQVVPTLLEALNHDSKHVHYKVVDTLVKIGISGKEDMILATSKYLTSENVNTRVLAAEVLIRIGKENPKQIVPIKSMVIEILNDTKWDVLGAAEIIGENAKKATPAELSELLDMEDIDLRSDITSLLGIIGKEDPKLVLPILRKVLLDNNLNVRETANRWLSIIGELYPE